MQVLFLGFGYTAQFLGDLLHKQKVPYAILPTRDHLKPDISHLWQDVLASHPKLDTDFLANPFMKACLEKITHIVITAPPQEHQDIAWQKYGSLILQNLCPKLKWVGYLSATSVYGGLPLHKNEQELPRPQTERGKHRLHAENIWMNLYHTLQVPIHIFRLSGIYGPYRHNLKDLLEHKAISIIKEGHISNRIYVRDIARALWASMMHPTAGEIFNLSDDLPSSSAMINEYASFILDCPNPPRVCFSDYAPYMSEMRKSFFTDNKIIDNQKIKKILGFELAYPTYREGIMDIIKQELSYKLAIH